MSIKLHDISEYFELNSGKPIGINRSYSVLMPFLEKDGKVFLLLEKRASDMEDAPGEICFPGGQMEEGETPTESAIRETEEELGIGRERIEIIGDPSVLYTISSSVIHVVPGIVDCDLDKDVTLNPSEVEEVFLAPLDFFVSNPPYIHKSILEADRTDFPYELAGIDESYPWAKGRAEVPVYNALPDGKIVWGLTANIIRHFVMDLLSQVEGSSSEE